MLSLINYAGIDFNKNISSVHRYVYDIQGFITLEKDVFEILSFTISDKSTSYKYLDFFHDSNFDGNSYDGNLIIINNHFQLIFEYSSTESPSKIQAISKDIYSTTNTSLDSYNDELLSTRLYVCDLSCSLANSTTLFYSIKACMCFNYT